MVRPVDLLTPSCNQFASGWKMLCPFWATSFPGMFFKSHSGAPSQHVPKYHRHSAENRDERMG